jgi:hypothetical protein
MDLAIYNMLGTLGPIHYSILSSMIIYMMIFQKCRKTLGKVKENTQTTPNSKTEAIRILNSELSIPELIGLLISSVVHY